LLKNYLQEGETLGAIPDSKKVIAFPEITFKEVAPLFDNLPAARKSEDIQSMEFFDQGWGRILYSIKLPKVASKSKIVITELHYWATVFIRRYQPCNGKSSMQIVKKLPMQTMGLIKYLTFRSPPIGKVR